jgi:arylsulfatase
MGKLDNTLIIYINGDNGTSAEGTLVGTPNEVAMFNGVIVPVEDQLKYFYEAWGTDRTYPHMAVPWAWAFDTPFSWTKQIASHFGGVRQGTAISWPKVIKDKGGIRNQFHHMIDIVPTILEATGVRAPKIVDGIKQSPIEGVSMMYTFDKKNADAPSTHRTQYFEMMGDHAIYHDGWIASTKVMRPPWDISGGIGSDPAKYPWELYDLRNDWTQSEDVAAKHPKKVKELEKIFWQEAKKYQVLPLDATVATRLITPRPSITAGRNVFTWTAPLTGTPYGDAPSILNASYTYKAEVEIAQDSAEGMLITAGGRFGGYGFYLLKGKPVFTWNLVDLKRVKWEGPDVLAPGKHTLEFDFKYDGLGMGTLAFNSMSGIGRSGTGVLRVDGKEVARQTMEHTIPLILQWDENLDVGSDTGTPVDDGDYQVPFAFSGKINKVTLTITRPKLTSQDEKKLMQAARNNKVSE